MLALAHAAWAAQSACSGVHWVQGGTCARTRLGRRAGRTQTRPQMGP
jgi:hypothetical protein